jgi:hypothetical protein
LGFAHRLVLDRTFRATGSANRLRQHGAIARSVPWRGRADRTLRAHATTATPVLLIGAR